MNPRTGLVPKATLDLPIPVLATRAAGSVGFDSCIRQRCAVIDPGNDVLSVAAGLDNSDKPS